MKRSEEVESGGSGVGAKGTGHYSSELVQVHHSTPRDSRKQTDWEWQHDKQHWLFARYGRGDASEPDRFAFPIREHRSVGDLEDTSVGWRQRA